MFRVLQAKASQSWLAQRRPSQFKLSQVPDAHFLDPQSMAAQRRPIHLSSAQRRPSHFWLAQRRPAQRRPSKSPSAMESDRPSTPSDQLVAAHLRVWGLSAPQASTTVLRSPEAQAAANAAQVSESAASGPNSELLFCVGSGGSWPTFADIAALRSRPPAPAPLPNCAL